MKRISEGMKDNEKRTMFSVIEIFRPLGGMWIRIQDVGNRYVSFYYYGMVWYGCEFINF